MANEVRDGYDEAILMDPQGYVCQGLARIYSG